MKPTISLSKSSPEEINCAVAEYVAGWKRIGEKYLVSPVARQILMPYVTDANAVIELLEKWKIRVYRGHSDEMSDGCVNYWVEIEDVGKLKFYGTARTFCLAACGALLRANGVEVTE